MNKKKVHSVINYKKWYLLICIMVFFMNFNLFSQTDNLISLSFNDDTIQTSIVKIENKYNYIFYYEEEWLKYDIRINKTFIDSRINTILEYIFKDTNINFLLMGNKIILTSNSLIKPISKNIFSLSDTKKIKMTTVNQKEHLTKSSEVLILGKEQKLKKRYYQLKGKITSLSTGNSLNNIKIKLLNENYAANSNKKGLYNLNVPFGYHTIQVKASNFKTYFQKIILYSDSNLNIKLKDTVENLTEVFISGKTNSNVKEVAIGLTAIKAAQIKIVPMVLGERDILKIATTIPGISTSGEGSLGYNIRGGKTDQNLILLDNATLYNPSHLFGLFSAINPYATASADIYKGSLPAEYGGRLSSIIDIKTKKINDKEFSGEGNIGLITYNLMLEVPIKKNKTAVLIGARSTYLNWILKEVNNDNIKNSNASFTDAIVRFQSKINKKNALLTTAYYSRDQFSVSSDSIYKYQNKLFSLEWIRKNINNKLSIQFNNSIYEFDVLNNNTLNKNFNINFSILENQFKIKNENKSLKKHKITYGLSGKLYHLNPGSIKPIGNRSLIIPKKIQEEKGFESGIFISDKYKFSNKLIIDFGFRYSFYSLLGEINQTIYKEDSPHIDANILEIKKYKNNEIVKIYNTPEIRLSARYAFVNDFSIKASYSNTAQYLHLLSSNTTSSPIDTWKLSNYNIKPQKSTQYSLGLFKNFKANEYELSLETYYKKMRNILEYKVGADLLLNNNIEKEILPGKGKSYGVEFLVRKNKGKFNGWFGYSYSKSLVKVDSYLSINQINNGAYFSTNYDRPHNTNLILNYKLTKRYSFSLNFNYQTGRPITFPIGKYEYGGIEHVVYSERNKFRIPDYYRLDLGINIEGNHKIKKISHSFWNISVYNVLGRNNTYSIFFSNDNGRIKAYQSSIFAMPIPTISYNFKF